MKGLIGFLTSSFLLYYLAYKIPPSVLGGINKVFVLNINQEIFTDKNLYALTLATIFVGLSAQPVLGVITDFIDGLRAFFQVRIRIPSRLNDTVAECRNAVEARSGRSKDRLRREIGQFTDPHWKEFRSVADFDFFERRYEKIVGPNGLDQRGKEDMLAILDATLTVAAVALIRKSGPEALSVLRTRLIKNPTVVDPPALPIATIGLVLVFGSIFIWFAIPYLDGPVSGAVGRPQQLGFWPDTEAGAIFDVLAILPVAFITLLYTAFLAENRLGKTQGKEVENFFAEFDIPAKLTWRVIVLALVLNIAILLVSLNAGGSSEPIPPNFVLNMGLVILLQSLIPVPPCLALLYGLLVKPPPSARRCAVITAMMVVAVAALSFLYARINLNLVILARFPKESPASEYLCYSPFLNIMFFTLCFLAIFTGARWRNTRKPAETPLRLVPEPPAAPSMVEIRPGTAPTRDPSLPERLG